MNEEPPKKVLTTGVGLFLCAVVGLFFEGHFLFEIAPPRYFGLLTSDLMKIVISLALTAASLFVVLRKDYV